MRGEVQMFPRAAPEQIILVRWLAGGYVIFVRKANAIGPLSLVK